MFEYMSGLLKNKIIYLSNSKKNNSLTVNFSGEICKLFHNKKVKFIY